MHSSRLLLDGELLLDFIASMPFCIPLDVSPDGNVGGCTFNDELPGAAFGDVLSLNGKTMAGRFLFG